MLLLSTQYSPSHYNKLPHIDRVVEIVENLNLKEVLGSLGQVFRKHEVTEKFGLTLVHRHFDLGDNEILVEGVQIGGKIRASVPWIFQGNELIAPANPDFWNSFGFPTGTSIQPQAWTFGDDGQLKSFEFQNKEDETDQEEPPKDFVAEVFAELKKRQLHDVFGIRAGGDPRKGIETTDLKNRANIVTFDLPPDVSGFFLITVHWGFDVNGRVLEQGQCFHGCGRGHGKHL